MTNSRSKNVDLSTAGFRFKCKVDRANEKVTFHLINMQQGKQKLL